MEGGSGVARGDASPAPSTNTQELPAQDGHILHPTQSHSPSPMATALLPHGCHTAGCLLREVFCSCLRSPLQNANVTGPSGTHINPDTHKLL